ncbi:MAG: glycosyltransferase family 4 protein [Candidatus Micrarchaeota archaeon]|nr:glycosyltransferase family 4 protein [Candidatus Micrarchaeota archaeon]
MKVAMLGWEFPPFMSGGLGVHCFELTRALCRLGVRIDFYMPVSGQKVESSCPSIRIIEVAKTELRPYLFFSKASQKASYGENLISAVREYWKKCEEAVVECAREEKYDLVHTHDWLTYKAGAEASRRLRMPLVQTFHSTEFDRTSWPWDYILGVEREAAEKADLIIAVSNRMKEQVMRLGAPKEKIRVVYNGVDYARFSCPQTLGKAEQNFKGGKKLVLFLGRLTEQKGPVQFLHAAKKVLSANPDVIFVIVGKGELLPLLINMSISLGISQNVRFLGFVPEEEQKKIYKMADVFVMPSTSEPFGITALEAMSSGVPVIISKTSGVAEIAKAAIKVDFWDIDKMADRILAVLKYQPLAATMSKLAEREASSFGWEKTAEKTLEVYKEALSKHAERKL